MKGVNELLKQLTDLMHSDAQSKVFAKGEMILREGEVEKNLYYIESGAIRAFLLNEFEELTVRFGYKGSIINSLASFYSGRPSEFYLEAIRRSVVRILPKEKVYELVNASEENLRGYISLLELTTIQQIEREIDILTVSPSERLKRVLQRSPHLFQEIPLRYIASYLRMTPETLSRIRNL
jgi:CRP/FNR family transcriptional regulator, anaerobic regulatory protein